MERARPPGSGCKGGRVAPLGLAFQASPRAALSPTRALTRPREFRITAASRAVSVAGSPFFCRDQEATWSSKETLPLTFPLPHLTETVHDSTPNMGFTPLPSFVGGLLLSYSTSTLLATQGRILGCSGVSHATVAGLLLPESPNNDRKQAWKWATTAGLVVGGMVLRVVRPHLETWIGASIFDAPIAIRQLGWVRILAAGFLVGAGTKVSCPPLRADSLLLGGGSSK